MKWGGMPEESGIVLHQWSMHAALDVCMEEVALSVLLAGAATCSQSLTCQEHIKCTWTTHDQNRISGEAKALHELH